MKSKRARTRSLAWLLAAIMGIVAGVISYLELETHRRAKGWPTAEGVILSSEIHRSGSARSKSSKAVIRYCYTVDSREYESNRIVQGLFDDRIVEDNPAGKRIPVHYDPRNPADAIYISAGPAKAQVGIAVGVVLFLLGTIFLIREIRPREPSE